MLLSVSNALILSQHSKHTRKSSLFAFGQNTFRSRSLLHQQIRTKGSFKILQIVSMKLIDTGRSTTSYTLMKFSMESVKILLCSFPSSARMRATGGIQTVALTLSDSVGSIQHRSDTRKTRVTENLSCRTRQGRSPQNPQELVSFILRLSN